MAAKSPESIPQISVNIIGEFGWSAEEDETEDRSHSYDHAGRPMDFDSLSRIKCDS